MPDIWMDVDVAVTVPVNVMSLIDDTDFKTREVAIAYNAAGMDLVWNFVTAAGVQTQTAVTPTTGGDYDWTHVGDGMYKIEITASGGASVDNDTAGYGWFSGLVTGVLPWRGPVVGFRAAVINDAMDNGTVWTAFEDQYDGVTGLSGDTYPATQAQIGNLSTGSAAISTTAAGVAASVPTVVGTPTNAYTDTTQLNGVFHSWVPDGGELEFAYNFNIGANASPTDIIWNGYVQSNNDTVQVYARNWVGTSWEQVGEIDGTSGTTDQEVPFRLTTAHVNTGANSGDVRIRFVSTGGPIITTFATERILCSFTITNQSIGYANGAIWYDDSVGNTNTVDFVDGVADNPVSTWAAVKTLVTSLKIKIIHIASGSTVTLDANTDGYILIGNHWTLNLGNQSCSGAGFHGASVTGICTGALEVHFVDCNIGTCTLPPSHLHNCEFPTATITAGSAGAFVVERCYSVGSPVFDFGSGLNASSLDMQTYCGNIEIQNMGAGTGSYTMIFCGGGTLIINANCSATSIITLNGNITYTNNASGITIIDEARFEVQQITGFAGALGDGSGRVDVGEWLGTAVTADTAGVPNINQKYLANSAQRATDLAEIAQYLFATNVTAAGGLAAVVAIGSVKAREMVISALTAYDQNTDSNQARRDRGDAAWTTATSVTVSDKTGFSLANGSIVTATFAAGAIDDAVMAVDAFDGLFIRDMDQVEGSAPLSSLCLVVLAHANYDTTTNPGFLTVFKTTGAEFAQLALSTDPSADPVDGVG